MNTRTSACPPAPKPRNKKENTLENKYITTEEFLQECSEEDFYKMIDEAKKIWDKAFNKQEDEIINSDEEDYSASSQQLLDAIRLVSENGEVYKRKS